MNNPSPNMVFGGKAGLDAMAESGVVARRYNPSGLFDSLMRRLVRILLSLALICVLWSGAAFSQDDPTELLPESVGGWAKSALAQSYSRQNLFDYIDGGAEVYLAYDFQQLTVQHYADTSPDSAEKGSITAEMWRMNSSADAFGLFSLERDGEKINVGQDGVYAYDRVRFWKGPFFVDVFSEKEVAKNILIKIGKKIASKIEEKGDRPPLVSKLPYKAIDDKLAVTVKLISSSVQFFHQYMVLRNLYFFERADSLGLDSETNCVLADYAVGGDTLKLLVIEYPDSVRATNAHLGFVVLDSDSTDSRARESLLRESLIIVGSEGTVGIDQHGRYLALVFGGQDKEKVSWLLSRVEI
jgi:hypothetical protein